MDDVSLRALMGAAVGRTPIKYVGGKTDSFAGSTTTRTISLTGLTGGIASAPAAGDLVLVIQGNAAGTSTAPVVTTAGYTAFYSYSVGVATAATGYARLAAFYKFMGATPDTSVVVDALGTSFAQTVIIQVWRNVDSVYPEDTTSDFLRTVDAVQPDPPAITPETPGCVIISAGSSWASGIAASTFSSSDQSGFLSVGVRQGTSGYTNVLGAGYYTGWSSGSYNPAAFTFNGTATTSSASVGATLALRPVLTKSYPQYVDGTLARATGSTSLVVSKPALVQAGDVMIAFMDSSGSARTWTGDTGWTELVDLGQVPSLRVAYKVATSSEPASYTFTVSASSTTCGIIVAYRNVGYVAGSAVGDDNSRSSPAQTANKLGIYVGCVGVGDIDTITAPATLTTRVVDNTGVNPNLCVADTATIKGVVAAKSFSSAAANANSQSVSLLLEVP